MKKPKLNKNLILVLASIVIAIGVQFGFSYILTSFEGTDDQAVDIIQNIAPGYQQWVEHLWEPGSDLTETIMFTFQTAIGISVIEGYFAYKRSNSASRS